MCFMRNKNSLFFASVRDAKALKIYCNENQISLKLSFNKQCRRGNDDDDELNTTHRTHDILKAEE